MQLILKGVLALALMRPAPDSTGPGCVRLTASGGSPDLYCIQLFGAPGFDATGTAELSWAGGPFTVGVSADGTHLWKVRLSIRGLHDSLLRDKRSWFVAWAAPPTMTSATRLGVVHDGEVELGPV